MSNNNENPIPKYVANFLLNDFKGMLKRKGLTIDNCLLNPNDIGLLLYWNHEGFIDRKMVKECVFNMLDKSVELWDFIDFVNKYNGETDEYTTCDSFA